MNFQVHQGPMAGTCAPMGVAGAPKGPGQSSQQAQALQMALMSVLQTLASLLKASMQQSQQPQQSNPATAGLAGGMPSFGMPSLGMPASPPQGMQMPFMPTLPKPSAQTPGCQPKPPVGGQQGVQGTPGAQGPQGTQGTQGIPAPASGSGGAKAGAPSGVPGAPDTVPKPTDKPGDPNKKVDDYLNANNGLLKNLGNQEGMKDKLKARYGDWDDPKRSEEDRKQSAFNASRHVGIIKNKKDCEGGDRGDVVTNGKMEGCTKDGDIRSGTEMAALKDSLKGNPQEQQKNTDSILGNPNLPETNNSRDAKAVRKNGTNRDGAEIIGRTIGEGILKGISTVFGALSSVIGNTLGRIPGIGKLLAAPAEALFGTISNYSDAGSKIVGQDLQGKERDKVLGEAGRDSAANAVGAVVGIVDPTGALSGIAEAGVKSAIDPSVPFDAGQAALDGMNPFSGIGGGGGGRK